MSTLTRGRPFEPGNKFGRGRPRGSRNKKTLLAQELLEKHGESLMAHAIVAARKDNQVLRSLIPYILPRRKDSPINLGPLPVGNTEELAEASEKLFKSVSEGKITPSDALATGEVLERHRRMLETGLEK